MNTPHVNPKVAPLDTPEVIFGRWLTMLVWSTATWDRGAKLSFPSTCNHSQDTWMASLQCESAHDSSVCSIQPEKSESNYQKETKPECYQIFFSFHFPNIITNFLFTVLPQNLHLAALNLSPVCVVSCFIRYLQRVRYSLWNIKSMSIFKNIFLEWLHSFEYHWLYDHFIWPTKKYTYWLE